ncbi:antibiotic biosynthesis monooxygenase [Pseudodesulfovibrio sp. JC047]|uniref:putative quinol monooxygenase n=1 Tax=Pseudodesulfovibrio sp. JC047 TaxID=2683199 RepID=UPI0013D1E375|nr:putative quinol monooxygenase [Pseudodesulfovibrio sp. JC047]NDV18473.1 antibiotic biosynthesis monooxygenase [Pseudodesulfovibrio sp. JC047]
MEIRIIALIEAKPGHSIPLQEKLEALVAASRSEPGCLTYQLHRDTKNHDKFFIYEIWENQTVLDTHNNAPHFTHFVESTTDMVQTLQVNFLEAIHQP